MAGFSLISLAVSGISSVFSGGEESNPFRHDGAMFERSVCMCLVGRAKQTSINHALRPS